MNYKNTKRPRPVRLENYRTGRIVAAPSIAEFCRRVKLNGSDRYHITPILDGDRLHHKGWSLPITKTYRFEDRFGNKFETENYIAFAKKHNVSAPKIHDLVTGKIQSYRGLFLQGNNNPPVRMATQYFYTFSNGRDTIVTNNISQANRSIGLYSNILTKQVHGKSFETRNGWRLIKVEKRRKKGIFSGK